MNTTAQIIAGVQIRQTLEVLKSLSKNKEFKNLVSRETIENLEKILSKLKIKDSKAQNCFN